MNMTTGNVVFVGGGVAVVVALLCFALAPVDPAAVNLERTGGASAVDKAGRTKLVKEKKPLMPAERRQRVEESKKRFAKMRPMEDWFAGYRSSADRDIGKRLQDALDENDVASVLAAAEEARGSKNAELRQTAAEMLSTQGEAAIPLLKKFVADGDRKVSDAAFDSWDTVVDLVEDEFAKQSAVSRLLEVATEKRHIEQAVSKIESLDAERAIRKLAELAESSNPRIAEAAKSSYENVSGEEWKGKGSALLQGLIRSMDRQELEADE